MRLWSPHKPPRRRSLDCGDDATLTIVPIPREVIAAAARRVSAIGARRLSAIMRSASAGRILSSGVRGGAHPALLTSTSTPSVAIQCGADEQVGRVVGRQINQDDQRALERQPALGAGFLKFVP